MDPLIFSTTAELTAKLAAEADEKTLILTSGGRLARRLRHAFRRKQKEKGRTGWLPAKVMTLNAWLMETWKRSWPEEIPASPLTLWRFWEKTVSQADLPEGIAPDLQLVQVLDDTYRVMVRDKVRPSPTDSASPAAVWREGLFREFERRLGREGLFHPAWLPTKVMEARAFQTLEGREKIFLVGFEFPAPVEADLIGLLRGRFRAVCCSTHSVQGPEVKAVLLPNREEEVAWLAEEVLRATREHPLHRIGVIVPRPDPYLSLIGSAFREILGPPVREEEGLYNLSLGTPLWDQPLVQAGVLPLRFLLEGEPRHLLLSLFLSPYYRRWQGKSFALARVDRLWRKRGIASGMVNLLRVLKGEGFDELTPTAGGEEPLAALLKDLGGDRRSVYQWTHSLRRIWNGLGYPVLRMPGEEGFFRHLQEVLDLMNRDLKDEVMDGPRFYAWLKTLLAKTLVNEPGYEQAGIQVLGMIEARGLDFDRLFLIGLTEESLPQPVRPFPLLTPEERRQVQGATLESQFAFAASTFEHLKTLSPLLTLTRPSEENGDPLPPSPFWPNQEIQQERNIWTAPGEVWIRAEWLRQTRRGIRRPSITHPPQEPFLFSTSTPFPVPATLSVSALETFLACPFRFFCADMMGIDPLEEIEPGIPAREKGEFVHKVLALITRTLRTEAVCLTDEEAVRRVVRSCLDQALEDRKDELHWRVERRRLMGDGEGIDGLLGGWLGLEKERLDQGWRWIKEEAVFDGLTFPGWAFSVRGRIDRIDHNKEAKGVCLWDYKTGSFSPFTDICERFLAPQLPLYLLAVQSFPEFAPPSVETFQAGFVSLKSEKDLAHKELGKTLEDWEVCLDQWVQEISRLGKRMQQGDFAPDPRPEPQGKELGACTYCDYQNLCAYWKRRGGGGGSADSEG